MPLGPHASTRLPRALEGMTFLGAGSREPGLEDARRETILVVEDQDDVRLVVGRILARRGYHVLVAAGAEEALALVDGSAMPIHLLLTDVVMPLAGGRRLADEVRRRVSSIQVLFTSGYPEELIRRKRLLHSSADLLPKPFTADQLLDRVRRSLDRARQRRPAAAGRAVPPDCGD